MCFKSGVSFSHSLLGSPPFLQSQTFWGLIFLLQDPPGCSAQCEAQTPSSSGRTSAVVIILPFMDHPPRVYLDYTPSPHLLPILLWFLLYIFSYRPFLLFFPSFSSVVALQVFVIFVCPWEELSSGSSYSTILAIPPRLFFEGEQS